MHAHLPDSQVTKDGFELGYVEVKPPKEERHQRAYLEDVWALSGLAKDNIDLHLRHGRIITTVPCVLVFGKNLATVVKICVGLTALSANASSCFVSVNCRLSDDIIPALVPGRHLFVADRSHLLLAQGPIRYR